MRCHVRLMSMYTNINLCAVIAYPLLPQKLKDFVRASTLLIFVAVATTWLSGTAGKINVELFDSFAPEEVSKQVPVHKKQACVLFFDVAFHVLPLILVGFPRHPSSLPLACGALLLWYALVRRRIRAIYSPSVPADESVAWAVIGALLATAWLLGKGIYRTPG